MHSIVAISGSAQVHLFMMSSSEGVEEVVVLSLALVDLTYLVASRIPPCLGWRSIDCLMGGLTDSLMDGLHGASVVHIPKCTGL